MEKTFSCDTVDPAIASSFLPFTEEEEAPKGFCLYQEEEGQKPKEPSVLKGKEKSLETSQEEEPVCKKEKQKQGIFDLIAPAQPPSFIATMTQESGLAEVKSICAPAALDQLQEIFEKVLFVTTKLYSSGDSETTLYLDDSFPSSLFQGAEIVISEYSTAPKIYNVQINACNQAVALLQSQAEALVNYVQERRLPFSIGRVTAGHKEEKGQRKKVESIHNQDKQSLSDGSL